MLKNDRKCIPGSDIDEYEAKNETRDNVPHIYLLFVGYSHWHCGSRFTFKDPFERQ